MTSFSSSNKFMDDALNYAKKANELGEVPVGCIFVFNNEIIATGCNLVNETKNATRHVEIICIDQVLEYAKAKNIDQKELFSNISVIVTVEPCIMCIAALINVRVKEIIFGCRNDRFGGCTVVDVQNLLKSKIPIRGGVRAEEAMELLKVFYKGENPSAPKKRKGKQLEGEK